MEGMKIRLSPIAASLLVPVALLLSLTAGTGACHGAGHISLTLSVAASLTNAVTEAENSYIRDHQQILFRNNFGSSGTLAREIEQGAPVDVFLSAASQPMNDLQAKGLILPGTRRDLLRNSLVLIAPLDSRLAGFEGLADPSVRLVALGDPSNVPAGQYGRQTLMALNLFNGLKTRLVFAKDVHQVLTYVETGNADAGLVYATDAQISGKVRVVATAPESAHDPIVYPAAVLASTRNRDAAREFVEFLSSSAARAVFQKHGFTMAP